MVLVNYREFWEKIKVNISTWLKLKPDMTHDPQTCQSEETKFEQWCYMQSYNSSNIRVKVKYEMLDSTPISPPSCPSSLPTGILSMIGMSTQLGWSSQRKLRSYLMTLYMLMLDPNLDNHWVCLLYSLVWGTKLFWVEPGYLWLKLVEKMRIREWDCWRALLTLHD